MEILLDRVSNSKLVGDSIEELELKTNESELYISSVFVAEDDGRIITKNGYISYKKGQVVISIGHYDTYGDCRYVMLDDPTLIATINELYNIAKTNPTNETI